MIRELIIVNKNNEMRSINIDSKNYDFIELIKKYPDMDEDKTFKMDYMHTLHLLIKEFPHRFNHMKNFKEDLSEIDNVQMAVLTFFERDADEYRGLEEYNICYSLTYLLKKYLLKDLMKINTLINDFKICNKNYEGIRKSSYEEENILNVAKYGSIDLSSIESIAKELVLKLELLKEMKADKEYEIDVDKAINIYHRILDDSSYSDFMEYESSINEIIQYISDKERQHKRERERFRIYDLAENSKFTIDKEGYLSTDEKAYLGNLYVEFINTKLDDDEILYDLSDFMYKFKFPNLDISKYERLISVNEFMENEVIEKDIHLIVIMYYKMYGTNYLEKFKGGIDTYSIKLMIEKLVNHFNVFSHRLFNEEYMDETGFDEMSSDTFLVLLNEAKTINDVLELTPRSFLLNIINIYLDNLVQDIDVLKRLDVKLYSHAVFSGRNVEDNLIYRELFFIDNYIKNI